MANKVIFIQPGREPYVWIGQADDVVSKLLQLQAGCPYPMTVIAVTDRPLWLLSEEKLENRFAEEHERGYWFRLSTRLAYFIRQLQTETTVEAVYRNLSQMQQRRLPRTVVAEYFTEP